MRLGMILGTCIIVRQGMPTIGSTASARAAGRVRGRGPRRGYMPVGNGMYQRRINIARRGSNHKMNPAMEMMVRSLQIPGHS